MKSFKSTLVAVSIVLSVSCGSNENYQSANVNERAEAMIDHGQYNEAILTLSAQVQQFPDDAKARLLLASALAGKHGIMVTSFTPTARVIVNWIDRKKSMAVQPGTLGQIQNLTLEIDLLVNAITSLPALASASAVEDLRQAVKVLEGSALPAGGYLYRALLKLVLFKFDLENNYKIPLKPNCEVDPVVVGQWFDRVEGSFDSIINDISLGSKDEGAKQKLTQLGEQIHAVSKDVNERLTGLDQVTLAQLTIVIKQVYPKCGS